MSAPGRPRITGVERSQERADWTERAAQTLAAAGYRRGGARSAIVELLGEQTCALSAAEIEQELRERERKVSRASVYRVIEELEGAGLLARVEVGHGSVRFEPALDGPGHHHHLVCDRCGRLQPFSDEGLERAIRRLSERMPARISEHEIVLRGACETCAPR